MLLVAYAMPAAPYKKALTWLGKGFFGRPLCWAFSVGKNKSGEIECSFLQENGKFLLNF